MQLNLSPELNHHLSARAQEVGLDKIAKSVIMLSDFYIQNPKAQTPWEKEFCQIAYEFYFFPLNYLRAKATLKRAEQIGFLKNISSVVEFGAGNGAASTALLEKIKIQDYVFTELSNSAAEKLTAKLNIKRVNSVPTSGDTLMMSYSLTELMELPKGHEQYENLILIEPGTSEDGRKLLQIRKTLLQKGFYAWAPCTHQEACPLLELSPKDWCHDRLHFEKPEWFSQLENKLPIKNNTLSWSYLLISKKPPPNLQNFARITGDQVEQKGKTLQLFCRGPQKEALSWLHRQGEPQEILRGNLIHSAQIPVTQEKQSFGVSAREIRVVDKIVCADESAVL